LKSKDGKTIWVADLKAHKNAHRGLPRRISIGPRAQKIIEKYVMGRREGFVFRADVSVAERRAEWRAGRRTPIGPAQMARDAARRAEPKIEVADHYTTLTYGRAIARAAARAKVPHWSPNMIRHSAATRIRREKSLETSSACLGHRDTTTTQRYAELDESVAIEAMAELG
jgi:integrase